jgi:hypothetical protein
MLSKQQIAEMFSIDYAEQADMKRQEELNELKAQLVHERAKKNIENSIAEQATQMAEEQQIGPGLNYDTQAVVGQADGIAQQMLTMPEGDRRSQLRDLQATDYVMYSVVIQRMEQLELETGRAGGMPAM